MQEKFRYYLNEREHALVHAQNIEHDHKEGRTGSLIVLIEVPKDVVANYDIFLGGDGFLGFETSHKNNFPRIYKNEDGTPRFYGGIYRDGSPKTPPEILVDTREIPLNVRVNELISQRIHSDGVGLNGLSLEVVLEQAEIDRDEIEEAKKLIPAEAERQRAAHEEYLREEKEKEAKKSAEEAAKGAKKAEELLAQTERDKAIRAWVDQKGSDTLKLGFQKGYACKKRFLTEWGTVELGPEYVLDYDSDVSRNDRSCPTEAALNEQVRIENLHLQDLSVSVVWLPSGLSSVLHEPDDSQEGVEVVITDPFDGYGDIYFYRTI